MQRYGQARLRIVRSVFLYKPTKHMLIGRNKELERILQEIAKPPTAGDVRRIIAINGIFGVGKSTLLREVIAQLQQDHLVDALLYSNEDAHIRHLPEFVYQLVNSFRACKENIPRFKSDETDSRWMRYYELIQESDPTTKAAEVKGPAASSASTDSTSVALKGRNADDRRLLSDTGAVMCETLIVDLMNTFFPLSVSGSADTRDASGRSTIQQRKIVIVVDTYEKMTTVLNTWLLEHMLLYCYIKRFGDFRSYNSPYLSPDLFVRQYFDIRFIIAGREPLRSTDMERRWDRWQQTLLEIGLHQFKAETVREYLKSEGMDASSRVDDVMQATEGLPYLLSLWSHTKRSKDNGGADQNIAVHARERIFWYKSQEQVGWITAASFCEWFDADILRCFPVCHERPTDAFVYLQKMTELSRESASNPGKWELLPIVRESINTAVRQESPEVAQEYDRIVETAYRVRTLLSVYQPEESDALRHVAYLRHCITSDALASLWSDDVDIIERLLSTSKDLFVRHKHSYSLSPDLHEVLQRFNAIYDRTTHAQTQQKVATLWTEREAKLKAELHRHVVDIESTEREIVRLTSEHEQAESELRNAQGHVMDLEQQALPLRKSTPPLAMNKDAAAARIAFVMTLLVGASAWYAPELLQQFQPTADLLDSIQKILAAFAVGFALLFGFFVSRSIALRSRRRQQQKDRQRLETLEAQLLEAHSTMNEWFSTVETKSGELQISQKKLGALNTQKQLCEELLVESYV